MIAFDSHPGYQFMAVQANQPLPDGSRLENYRIASVLSCGGFSIVYLAYDENDLPVAIKEYLPSQLALRKQGQVLPSIAEENLATFRHGMRCFFEEGRSLAGLSHPNVVRVLNFFRANETVYLVMRYERGRTLHEHSRRGAAGSAKVSSATCSPCCSTDCAKCTPTSCCTLISSRRIFTFATTAPRC
jgi:serine/threonine protein kinase